MRGQAPAKMSIDPPTPENMSGDTSASRLVDRVVLGPATHVGAGRPLLAHGQLPVQLRPAVLRPVVPVALLETDDAEACLGQAQCHDTPGRAGADDQDVCWFPGQRCLLPKCRGVEVGTREGAAARTATPRRGPGAIVKLLFRAVNLVFRAFRGMRRATGSRWRRGLLGADPRGRRLGSAEWRGQDVGAVGWLAGLDPARDELAREELVDDHRRAADDPRQGSQ